MCPMIDGCHAMWLITRLGISFFVQLLSGGCLTSLAKKKKKKTKNPQKPSQKSSPSLLGFLKLLLWNQVVGDVFSGMEILIITLIYTIHVRH
jgi:hypothetical protein